MNYLTLGIIGFTVGLSGAMLPGPMLIYTISQVIQGSVISGIKIVFGHMLIEAVTIVLILLGLKEIIGSRFVSNILALIGGIAIFTLGLYIILKAGNMKLRKDLEVNLQENIQPSECDLRKSVLKSNLIAGGIFFTAFNPTFPTWWVSVGASLLSRALLLGLLGVVILVGGHWLADLTWFGLVSFTVGKGRFLLNDRRYQSALRVLGLALLGLGLWFIFQLF